jgi:predicted 3-demethylubiquinone-9 3-methyltransferase (glyoxalase superfamily)
MGLVLADYADRSDQSDHRSRPPPPSAFDAMMEMKKIDIAAIEAARRS